MKKNFFKLMFAVSVILFSNTAFAQNWINASTDFVGDGIDAGLLDATSFDYYYDQASDSLWFRITVDSIKPSHEAAFGVNVMVYIFNGGPAFNFWGMQNTDPFHRLLTVWVTGTPPVSYTGTIGISDSAGVVVYDYNNLYADNISILMDVQNKQIILGVKRNDFVDDMFFGTNTSLTVGVQAAVGSNIVWNDDIYFAAAIMTINKSTAGINPVSSNPSEMKVYNSSSKAELIVDFGSPYQKEIDLIISDAIGNIVREYHNIHSTQVTINTSWFSKGIYIVRAVTGNNSVITKKVMIE